MTILLISLGAAIGAPTRYLLDRAVQARHDAAFPWGTFTVNVAACLILGAVTGVTHAGATHSSLQALLGVGFCGALSTFSTFPYETMRLYEQGSRFFAAANIVVSIAAGLGAAYIGNAITLAV